MKLGTLLLRDGVINLDQLEAALRAQVLFGGKLGTNLVELGHISLDTLAIYLGKTLGVPAATKEVLEAADPAAIQTLGPPVVAAHSAFPFAFEDEGGRRVLAMAMVDPRNRSSIDELERHAGHPVKAYIAGELRLFHYLEKHYGVKKASAVFASMTRSSSQAPLTMRRAATPLPIPGQSKPLSISPRARTPVEGIMNLGISHSAGQGAGTSPAPRAPLLSLMDGLKLLEQATSREEIGDALLRFARDRVETGILFVATPAKGTATGWKGFTRGESLDDVESITLPLASPSFLSAAYETRRPWRGHPALELRLAKLLGSATPVDDALVIPVAIGARIVNLLFVHGPNLDAVQDALESLGEATSQAYARLIQSAKR